MDLLEVRELRYFVAVAEELHFGRAASRLHIAQPALSKTIQRVETRLGVQLFIRTSRNVTLTNAGEALLEQGRHALNAMVVAVRSAQQAAESGPLRLAMKPGGDAGLLSALLAEYAKSPDARHVDIMFHAGPERADLVRNGRADAALLYAPFEDLTGLATATLHVEDRVAVLPEDHRLARHPSIRSADLDGEIFPRWRDIPDDGSDGPELNDVAELIPMVRIGRVVAVLPRSLVTPAPPGTICVPVADAEPSYVVLGHAEHDHRDSLTALVNAAATLNATS
ncbi:LysR family transcriptional regulator [Saccharopolyspora hirsuta]|uniref:LysR family transcriptional regulator n=1 Tax=Saccharopolyspora hirsuta TaxID=1837 RepID=A0A5M7C6L7_SACHI|nr:LysR family transcriptional regulator [Saccharopolyspora hirsuta]KAA5837090.1 LysR family transcriptional regulator [Saccharopolyspora hirsuta]